jgi:hypothetical protein
MASEPSEELSLADATTHLLEECRMVLPGFQALFGFQLICVFSPGFVEQLASSEQRLHLLALALVAIAGALVMTPAAYHRQIRPREASSRFFLLGGRLLLWAIVPFMIGIGLDFYLIARVILGARILSGVLAGVLVALFAGLWFGLPRVTAARGRP